jgi:hypothetical protein
VLYRAGPGPVGEFSPVPLTGNPVAYSYLFTINSLLIHLLLIYSRLIDVIVVINAFDIACALPAQIERRSRL